MQDTSNWSNAQFVRARSAQNYRNCELAWQEQRAFARYALASLPRDSPLLARAEDALRELVTSEPSTAGYDAVADRGAPLVCAAEGVQMQFDAALGHLVRLVDSHGRQWASRDSPAASLFYRTYNETDFARNSQQYDYYGGCGFFKPNATSARPDSRPWYPSMTALYRARSGACSFLVRSDMPAEAWSQYGAWRTAWLNVTAVRADTLLLDLRLLGKTSTRLPEAAMLSFATAAVPNTAWYMDKLGELIQPTEVVQNGSQYQHAVWSGIQQTDAAGSGMRIGSLDAAVVLPVTRTVSATVFPTPLRPLTDAPTAMAFNLFNNIWDTNYVLWYPYVDPSAPDTSGMRFRFTLEFR